MSFHTGKVAISKFFGQRYLSNDHSLLDFSQICPKKPQSLPVPCTLKVTLVAWYGWTVKLVV